MVGDISIAAIIFCCCISFPILRVKQDLVKMLVSILFYRGGDGDYSKDEGECCSGLLMDLPIIKFEDIQRRRHRSVDEICFICLREYRREDVVSQLGRCGHVFHTSCIGKLMNQQQQQNFCTCPYCKSPIFHVPTTSNNLPCIKSL